MKGKSTRQPQKSAKRRSRRAVANVIAEPVPAAAQDYVTAFNRLFAKRNEIVDWKFTRTLEEAKRLSINAEFQKALETIRKRYQISPKRQGEVIDPQLVLGDYTVHVTEQDKEKLNSELSALADKFDLRWFDEGDDYGLIVGALCYGLTPDNLTEHWDEIKFSMSKTRTRAQGFFWTSGKASKTLYQRWSQSHSYFCDSMKSAFI